MTGLHGGKMVRVELPDPTRSYDIAVGDGMIGETGMLVRLRLGPRRCVIITDDIVAPLYLPHLEAVMIAAGHTLKSSIVIPAGEGSKDFSILHTVLEQLLSGGLDRNTVVVALGGGVVGDLGGMAASLAMRGLDLVQIPTTLLSQVDSSVGGKTGINTSYGKNTVGTFHQPSLVLADVATLDSLPRREMLSGYAEVVKYGLIRDAAFFQWCLAHGERMLHGDHEAQITAVSRSCEHKAQIVATDERDTGMRNLLNLGHTFAHALETVCGYGRLLMHGEAVSIGMGMAFRLSSEMGLCPREDSEMVIRHLESVGLPIIPPLLPPELATPDNDGNGYSVSRLTALMEQDKKSVGGNITLVLARGIGQAFVRREIPVAAVTTLWQEILTEVSKTPQ